MNASKKTQKNYGFGAAPDALGLAGNYSARTYVSFKRNGKLPASSSSPETLNLMKQAHLHKKIRQKKSMQTFAKLTIIFLFFSAKLHGQNPEIDGLIAGELNMTFPSIYFKHNSTDYATMPYPVDSCFKYIATKIKELNSYPVWRDSTEKERLTYLRIQKLRSDLNKYVPSKQIHFESMGTAQKISQRTIEKGAGDQQIQYLLSLNSVLDVSGAIKSKTSVHKKKKQRKKMPRLVWCGWKHGFHWSGIGS